MSKSPSYIYARPSGFFFCLNVPADLRDIVNRNQLRHSLQTHDVSLAKHRATYLAFWCKALLRELREGKLSELTRHDIHRLVQRWLHETLELTELGRVETGPYSAAIVAEELGDMRRYERAYRSALARRDYGFVADKAELLLNEEGVTVDRESTEFKRLCRELLKAGVRHALAKRDKGIRKIAREMGVGVSVVQRVSAEQNLEANN